MDNEQALKTTQTQPSEGEIIKSRLRSRLYRALDYLTIYLFILVVYGGAVITDYLLFLLLWALLGADVREYPLVAMGFQYARIGLALLCIVSAVIHGIISTYSQVKLDIKLSQEGEQKK